MLPTPKSAHVDSAMSQISVMHKNQIFIADRVFPSVPVKKQSDYFFKFLKGAWFRNEAGLRGPGGRARRGGYPVTTDSYHCKEYAFAHPIPIELINNADEAIRPWQTGIVFATDLVMLAKEKIVSDLVVTAGNWTSSEDVEAGWVAGSGNTFIADVLGAKETVRKLIGRYPNAMIIEAKTFKQIKLEDTVLDRIKYSGTQGRPADVTTQTLAQLFELDEVMIGGSIYSSAEEIVGGADWTAVDLWETTATKGGAFLYYRPPSPGLEVPAAGYCFNWNSGMGQESKVAQGGPYRQVRYWWEDAEKQWVVEASESFDAHVISADAGYLFYDTLVT
jgi:hypothetical protein